MRSVLRGYYTIVWIVLMLATGISWRMGGEPDIGDALGIAKVSVIVILIAFFKARLVLLHFMELRTAPWQLRLLSEAWIVLAAGGVLGTYLLA